jgi:hypothetical protein
VANQLIELGSPRAVVGICDEAEALCSSARERFAIARLRATVEALTGQWHRAAGTLSRLVDAETGIEQRDVLVSDVLDLLEAQARSHARWPETVATASDIAVDVSLPDLTRLRAAALLLRVTANLGDQPSAHATWRAVRDINPIDVTSSELKLQAGMIYHLSFGSIPEGREAAEQLATRIAGSGGRFRNVALLIGLANAAQIYGDDAIAAEHASRAYGVSVSLSLSYYAVRAALRLAGIAIEQQDDRRARNWYEAALPHADNCLDAETAYELADTYSKANRMRPPLSLSRTFVPARWKESTRRSGIAPISRPQSSVSLSAIPPRSIRR